MLEAAKMANKLEVLILTKSDAALAALAAAITTAQDGWSALPYNPNETSGLRHQNIAILPHLLEEKIQKIPSRVQHRDS